jgi:nucleoside-diphosphate-sugar epimerase
MIHAGDVARVLVAALRAPCVQGVLSAGTGRRISVNEIARAVIEAAASSSVVEHVPMRRGEPPTSVVLGDPSTLIPIGVDPATLVTFEEGVRRTLEWYRANPGCLD